MRDRPEVARPLKIKNIDGKPQRVRTDFLVGQEVEAQRWADEQEERLAATRAIKPSGAAGPLTVTMYARAWLEKRKTKTVTDDRGRLEKHVIPRIGRLELMAVRPRHLRDLILALREETKLAPKTIREIAGCSTRCSRAP